MHSKYRSSSLEPFIAMITRRPLISGAALFVVSIWFVWWQMAPTRGNTAIPPTHFSTSYTDTSFDGNWTPDRDRSNMLLSQQQCRVAFPGLFEEVERAVDTRRSSPVTLRELDSIEPKNGYIRAMIYDQELYVIGKQGNIYSREKATLLAIQRAIMTSPEKLPNIEFAFNTDDIIFEKVALWGYARKSSDTHIWLIPDFGYWSWPETKVGTLSEVQTKAREVEEEKKHSLDNKIAKLLWRGATMGLPLRDRLLEVTKGQSWADVVALEWHNKESMAKDLKSMPEHCEYKYLAHTEGNSYSGRLKYLQACESVVVAHEMNWIQHHHPLMKSSGSEQNYVEVDRNFNKLKAEIERLEQEPEEAKRIAQNNARTFRDRYLTPAAEACYWRALIHGWASVSFKPEFYKYVDGKKQWRGLPIESFALEGRLEWDPY